MNSTGVEIIHAINFLSTKCSCVRLYIMVVWFKLLVLSFKQGKRDYERYSLGVCLKYFLNILVK